MSRDLESTYRALADLDRPCYISRSGGRITAGNEPLPGAALLAVAPPLPPEKLGSPQFTRRHGLRYPYMAGSMAGGIASTRLVAALAKAGCLASFGAAGLDPHRIEAAVSELSQKLGELPYAANLIHSPQLPRRERETIDVYLRHRVRCIEASAFLSLSPELVRYRLSGLRTDPAAGVHAEHRLIAKVSRAEIAALFLSPAPEAVVTELLAAGAVTAEQARLARNVPMADDITVEADSGGHTDRRPLAVLVPQMLRLRDQAAIPGWPHPVRIGAAGSIGTPQAVHAAFALGAEYVVTGSVNQACVEAGTSPAVKGLLAQAGPTDCTMAPAADMFEAGAEVQVLSKGTLFAQRAALLSRLYRRFDSIEAIPQSEMDRLRTQVFQRDLDRAWDDTAAYLRDHDPTGLERAEADPRHRMALLFRSYLGLSSRWATSGSEDRLGDYQIWCGPAMGAFNLWARSTFLEPLENRRVADIAEHLLLGAAFHSRVTQLRFAGVRIPPACAEYRPSPLPEAVAAA
ncbi:PfaD family polyunsaturated fatty acid/polyketide biosynthesis protein [Glycomyces luteolus]|uniref:PfaD family polyunsaturated fatty acid/polyketide biosynthesis protein n=1 Tax=Glycomyces luteolus TaxID=2670330 RepID=A0A9X3PE55_9ACTN|nr:PfaD family polyunsaturated fatty acid/polyketide biosynthesis protein [Glycomyces luteolus]MDA1360934.1 PfaD family polyunsaturated fatty acid/polyketide biosynthesis protein [Glycomyces luteolus]